MREANKLHVEEYISIEAVLNSDNIMILRGIDGSYFVNLDPWEETEAAKEWFRFSLDPFDLDFLKFHRLGEGFIESGVKTFGKLYNTFEYLNICSNKNLARYSCMIEKVFFYRGSSNKALEEFNMNTDNKISYQTLIRVKSIFKSKCKMWLQRIFQEYNEFDNSIEYIKLYYKRWILLVELVQTFNNTKQNALWRFIKNNKIKSLNQFECYFKSKDKFNIRGLSDNDKDNIFTLLGICKYNTMKIDLKNKKE